LLLTLRNILTLLDRSDRRDIRALCANETSFHANNSLKSLINKDILSNLEKDWLRGEDMPQGVPKKDGSGRGRGQSGEGCGGNPRKRKGRNK
jgi:hypothetical protein